MSLTTSVPFNTRILTDTNYIVTASLLDVTPALDFIQATPWPTTTERTILYVTAYGSNATSSGVTASIVLQHSDDNVTWTNVSQKANPFIALKQMNSTAQTSSVQTSFEPDGKRYFRASASVSGTGNITGSYNLTVGF